MFALTAENTFHLYSHPTDMRKSFDALSGLVHNNLGYNPSGITIDKLQDRIHQMQFQIDQMNRLLYGAKRERFISNPDKNQLSLPFEVDQEETPETQQEVITYVREKKKRKEHPGRVALPSHLPVEEIVLEPEEDNRI